MAIHPTAVIDKRAEIDPTAEIGPYAIIDGPVCVGAETVVMGHAFVCGHTTIGRGCRIFPHSVVGHEPQDLAYRGDPTRCVIGDEVIIREGVTVHRGTQPDTETVIGDRCYLMANAHVGHNCVLANDVKLVNAAVLGGHVQVGPSAFLSGNSGVHQFVRIGELAMMAGVCRIVNDLPPFMLSDESGRCAGINVVGLRRANFTADERNEIRMIHRLLYRSGRPFSAVMPEIEATAMTAPAGRLVAWLKAPSKRGLVGSSERLRSKADARASSEPA